MQTYEFERDPLEFSLASSSLTNSSGIPVVYDVIIGGFQTEPSGKKM